MLAFEAFVLRPAVAVTRGAEEVASPLQGRVRRLTYLCIAIAMLSGGLWVLLEAGQMSGLGLGPALREGAVWTVLSQTTYGLASDVRLALLIGLALTLRFARISGAPRHIPVLLAAALLGALAWTGHAVATSGFGGDLHLAADVLHLLAAGAWIGGLVPLCLVLVAALRGNRVSVQLAQAATVLFSRFGIVSVGTLLASGIINTLMLAGSIPALLGTDYGRLLLIKIASFLIMVGFAAFNRFKLTPRISALSTDRSASLRRLSRNAKIELVLGFVVFGIVGVLGIMVPGLHSQPEWPFPYRLNFAALSAPENGRTAFALAAVGAGLLLIIGGLFWREFRLPLLIGGAVVAANFVPALGGMLEPAYPTTFYSSPTGFSASSIVRGAGLFRQNCSSCHGPYGRGDGPAAAHAKRKPADLTADHIYAHTDGDLFWWISHGIDDVMLGFADALDEGARWNLIDFVHANADAARLRAAIGTVTTNAYPMPPFSARCPDGSTLTSEDLRGRIVHLAFGIDTPELLRSFSDRSRAAAAQAVLISRDKPAETERPVCIIDDETVMQAMSLYLASRPEPVDRAEFLVDTNGALRALWHPGVDPPWTDASVFKQVVDKLRRTPANSRAASHHVHG